MQENIPAVVGCMSGRRTFYEACKRMHESESHKPIVRSGFQDIERWNEAMSYMSPLRGTFHTHFGGRVHKNVADAPK